MKRRDLLKSLTVLPLAGAAATVPTEASAQTAQTGEWTPKKQVITRTWRRNNEAMGATTNANGQPVPPSVLSGCIRSGHLLFVAGIGGWYPERRAEPGDIQVQIRSVLEILKDVLESAGSSMANALRVHMTVVEPNQNIAALNEAYRGHFPDPAPVRSYTGTSADLMGRDGVLVQLDCIAYVD